MSRLSRKKRGIDQLHITNGALQVTDFIDNIIKETWYINDQEYDKLCEVFTDDELELFITESPTFGEKKKILSIIDKYLGY